jgi:transcriptional regulator with XRE-family HTH domain
MTATLANTLRFTRLEAKKTLKDIERSTGISNAYLSQLENGKIVSPHPSKLELLAPAYGIPCNLLMIMAGYAPVETPDASLELPLFIREAGAVLTAEDWELLRGMVRHLVRSKTGALAQ